MITDIKQALKTAVEDTLKGGTLSRSHFIEQLRYELKEAGFSVRSETAKNKTVIHCETGTESSGFQIALEQNNDVKFSSNECSVTPSLSGDFNIDTAMGQKGLVDLIGKWIGSNAPVRVIERITHPPRTPLWTE